jgi:hypothetical protein
MTWSGVSKLVIGYTSNDEANVLLIVIFPFNNQSLSKSGAGIFGSKLNSWKT